MENNITVKAIIEGKKVKLRPICISDTELIIKWRNTPSVRKNFIFRETFTKEMHMEWLKSKVDTGEVVQYIVIETKSDIPVGSVYFRNIDKKNNSAEFGIFIGEENARGKGIGTEATRLFVDYGFENLGLHRIMLRVLKQNDAALKSYQNAGFEIEGCFRDMVNLEEGYRDVVFMSIINN